MFMVGFKKIIREECGACIARMLCLMADQHRMERGFCNIDFNSPECIECREKYAESCLEDAIKDPSGRGGQT
jgi:hypothetical protein